MKLNKKAGILSMLIFAGAACPAVFAEPVPQSSVLSGVVTSVVEENAVVKEGQVIVTVDSLVGPVPAARADADGVVQKVLVVKGQRIDKQQAVAVIDTNKN